MYDDSGYVVSFKSTQVEEYLKFWEEHGFVVINDALTEDEINATINEMWVDLTLLGKTGNIDRNNPNTWENVNWPTAFNIAERGFLSFDDDVHLKQSWNNRQNPRIYSVFKNIWKRPDLWVKLDRYGVMRPTKNVPLRNEEGQVVLTDKPEWQTKSNWLHWDQNPWSEPDFVRVQGLVTFTDSTPETGGFHCVPGFHHLFKEWSQNNETEKRKGGIINVPANDPTRERITKITMRKGSLVIWDSRICHGNYPNESAQFRMVQYLTFHPAATEEERLRRNEIFVDGDAYGEMKDLVQWASSSSKGAPLPLVYKYPDGLTKLGKLVLGAEPWTESNIKEVNENLKLEVK
eukprot:TRINITY_DN7331_c0_g2_i1.p1 TRINITY_DN7331_c0_g2~~TRINITY_DN7331_c0_g2_i1.p1  ORF type:complete len:347 (-),score=65.40 TRINITY_DN7331_c0_g2_i1:74-1114(-)